VLLVRGRAIRASRGQGRYISFSSFSSFTSFTSPQYAGGAALAGGVLSLSKIGRIRIREHRSLQGTPTTVTISREADGWYACFSCADVPAKLLPRTGQETGIDVGLKVFLIAADGQIVENPRHYRKAERQLAKAQRRVARRKKGSHRRRKAVALLKRTHQPIARQRRDFPHKPARALLRQSGVIYLEDLQVRNMGRTPTLPSVSAMRVGGSVLPSSRARQHGPASA
jgi:putative transposase